MPRPTFTAAWLAASFIHTRSNQAVRVATVIGSRVAGNINNPNPTQRWGNTCAVPMRYILNHSGLIILGITGQAVSGWSDAQGYATLLNGRICYEQCYFNEPEASYLTDRANFWSLS